MLFFKTFLSDFKNKYTLFYFLTSFLVLLFWYLGQRPGLFSFDTLLLIQDINQGRPHSGWNSYLFSNIIRLFLFIKSDLRFLGLFNVFSLSLFLSLSFSWFQKKGAPVGLVMVCFLWLIYTPQTGLQTFQYERDYFSAWLGMATLFLVFTDLFNRSSSDRDISSVKTLVLSLLACCYAMIKQDTSLVVLALAFVYFLNYKKKKIFFKKFLPILFLCSLLINIVIPLKLRATPISDVYLTTALINPVKYILQNVDHRSIDTKDLESIGRIVEIKDLVEDTLFVDIGALWEKGKHKTATAEEFLNFRKSSLRLIFSHPLLFLKERMRLFYFAAGFGAITKYAEDQLVVEKEKQRLVSVITDNNIQKEPFRPSWLELQKKWYLYHALSGLTFKHLFFASLTPFFLSLLFFLFSFFKFKLWSSGAVLFLVSARFLVVFFCAPAAYYKYYFGLYILAFFLPLMVYLELKSKTQAHMK